MSWFKKRKNYKALYDDVTKNVASSYDQRKMDLQSINEHLLHLENELGFVRNHSFNLGWTFQSELDPLKGRVLNIYRHVEGRKFRESIKDVVYEHVPNKDMKLKFYGCKACSEFVKKKDLQFHAVTKHDTSTYYILTRFEPAPENEKEN